jgi:hypothetical protein
LTPDLFWNAIRGNQFTTSDQFIPKRARWQLVITVYDEIFSHLKRIANEPKKRLNRIASEQTDRALEPSHRE